MTRQVQGDQVPEKTFNQFGAMEVTRRIRSSLTKEEMIKIAESVTPFSDVLIRQIPGPQEGGT